MKYSIIIPTYKRPEKLIRSVSSVLKQHISNIQILIINDSPDFDYSVFDTYLDKLSLEEKSNILYAKNIENKGVNFSRNLALTLIDADTEYVVFLDDDDWFGDGALVEVDSYLSAHTGIPWLMTNRLVHDMSSAGHKKSPLHEFFLKIGRCILYNLVKMVGDATHILRRDIALSSHFSKKVKNGEEWFYFIQLSTPVVYENLNTTESEGYEGGGLNAGMQQTYKTNTRLLWGEITGVKMFIYMALRSVYAIIKR